MPEPRQHTYGPTRRQVGRRWRGTLPARSGVLLVVIGTAVGGAATVLTHREPGTVLGVFLIAATVAGALAVRPEAVRLIIPVPALAYAGAAVIAGLVRDRATGTSLTSLAIGAVQWVASGFLAMSTATVLAIAVAAARRRPAPQRATPPTPPPPGRPPLLRPEPPAAPPRGN